VVQKDMDKFQRENATLKQKVANSVSSCLVWHSPSVCYLISLCILVQAAKSTSDAAEPAKVRLRFVLVFPVLHALDAVVTFASLLVCH